MRDADARAVARPRQDKRNKQQKRQDRQQDKSDQTDQVRPSQSRARPAATRAMKRDAVVSGRAINLNSKINWIPLDQAVSYSIFEFNLSFV